jgi:hypothetical protein
MNTASTRQSLWLPVALAVAALGWRVVKLKFGLSDVIPNFAPWMALAFAGSIVMPRTLPWWLWPALLLGCDLAVGTGQIQYMWLVYACYGAAAIIGSQMRGKAGVMKTLLGTAIGSIAFYVITNTQAWYHSPSYAQTLAGWLQAQTVGDLVHLPQSWIFLVRSLLSDVGFAALLVLAYNSEASVRRLPTMRLAAA